jgi:integrase
MSVILRKQVNKSGNTSYYLDINHSGARRKEFWQGGNLKTSMTPTQRRIMMQQINAWADKRAYEIRADINDLPMSYQQHLTIAPEMEKYLTMYPDLDNRKAAAAFKILLAFFGLQTRFSQLTEMRLQDWIDHMDEKGLSGDTIKGYWIKVRDFLARAHHERLYKIDPNTIKLEKPRVVNQQKQILSLEELQLLAAAPCPDPRIKVAFLFSCYTGLDFRDIYTIRPTDIRDDRLRKVRSKTHKYGNALNTPFNDTIRMLLSHAHGTDGYIFDLPKRSDIYPTERKRYDAVYNLCRLTLKSWVRSAGIDKSITWHCARHTFITNIEANEKTKRKLGGWSASSKMVTRYDHILDPELEQAIASMPHLDLII